MWHCYLHSGSSNLFHVLWARLKWDCLVSLHYSDPCFALHHTAQAYKNSGTPETGTISNDIADWNINKRKVYGVLQSE
jgi:hypothetical protein